MYYIFKTEQLLKDHTGKETEIQKNQVTSPSSQ